MLRQIDAPGPEFMTIVQAARWLGIPKSTLECWERAGAIPRRRHLHGSRVLRWHWLQVYLVRERLLTGELVPPDPPKKKSKKKPPPEKPGEGQRSAAGGDGGAR